MGFGPEMEKFFASAVVLGFVSLSVAGQELGEIEFFKKSVGLWQGRGNSEVGPGKTPLKVIDVWRGSLVKGGTVFVQDGNIKLSNGGNFSYRWVYRYEEKRLIARYADSNQTRSLSEVALSEDKTSITVTPLSGGLMPVKHGLFTTVTLKDGAYLYDAELRDKEGKVTVKSVVKCVPQVGAPAKKKEQPGKGDPAKKE